MPDRSLINVYVVDDHLVVRMGIKTMLESEPDLFVVGMASSGVEALEQIPLLSVDILLTDLRMAEMTGEELMTRARRSMPGLRCAVLTNYHSDEDVFRSIQAGAMGYILKTAPLEGVVSAIRRIHAGQRYLPIPIAEQLAEHLGRVQLSVRELEILQLVAKGLRNRDIASRLFISAFTVRNHVNNLLEKLGTRDRTEATAVAIRRGLVRPEDV